jgi:hypothetical protein
MLYLIDGTGEFFDDPGVLGSGYKLEMKDSFCNRLYNRLGPRDSKYMRGPSLSGIETKAIAFQLAALVSIRDAGNWSMDDTEPEAIYICGYSRGGAAAIIAAQYLNLRSRPIKAMFLFDAVDRTIFDWDAATIPGNVKRVYHARRDPAFTQKAQLAIDRTRPALREATSAAHPRTFLEAFVGGDTTLSAKARDAIDATARTRQPEEQRIWAGRHTGASDFGNAGLHYRGPRANFTMENFEASHGALGGVPWPNIRGDAAASEVVRSWMWRNFNREGFAL